MTTTVVVIFLIVYAGMLLGGLPFLQLDRTGIALLGAIALITFDAVPLQEAAEAIHLPTIILLFSFMVPSAQMRLGGFYDGVTRTLAALPLSPPRLLGALMAVAAALSAVFSNDIVCLAVALVLIHCRRSRSVSWRPGRSLRGTRGVAGRRATAKHPRPRVLSRSPTTSRRRSIPGRRPGV